MKKLKRNEKETREQLIDPKLKLADWEIVYKKGVIEKGKACIETEVNGLPVSTQSTTGKGFVDYTLFGDDAKPLAIIEAKKSVINEENGKHQASLYADALEKQYGVRPVIYYTNGYVIKIIDGIYPAREVSGFHKKEELEYIIKKRQISLKDKTVNSAICGRYYQMDAIAEIIKHIETKHTRSLIVLATGTGKTRTACGLSDVFLRNNYVKRILFLADRTNLVKQAKEETFDRFLPTISTAIVAEGKHDGMENARVVFSTYQSMLSIIQDVTKTPFGIGHFDLIIVDEAHRSVFNKYSEIFNYFDALMIGLTATPRDDINKSTYKVFDLINDEPNYEYSLKRAVKEGYLTYFRALDRTPKILKDGLTYDELSDDEKEEYETVFADEDGNFPTKVESKEFHNMIINEDTIDKVLQTLMSEGLYTNNGNILGKTIIFARDQNHANKILLRFNILFTDEVAKNPNYCVIIHSGIPYNDDLQRRFKTTDEIRVVISVDMMDTGVDIPDVVNLVFFKKVQSKIKFWQMIGRGTRLCENINVISPSKAYFERQTNDNTRQLYKDKQGFLIFDICNVFPYFKEFPDGSTDDAEVELSLNQKIFVEKCALYMSMQYHYINLSAEDRKFYVELREDLVNTVKGLNKNYIGVQKNLKYVEYYSDSLNWDTFLNANLIEIKKHIAPNVVDQIDASNAKIFDYLSYRFSSTKLVKTKAADFGRTAKAIYFIASQLNRKMDRFEINAQKEHIEYLISTEFLTNTSVTKMEEIREHIRELMKYVEFDKKCYTYTHFKDLIDSTNDADDSEFELSIDDFKTFEEKITHFITTNKNMPAIHKIINMQKPNDEDINNIKTKFKEISKNNDYNELFVDDSVVPFVRRSVEINPVAINNFLNEQRLKGRNEYQIAYINELLTYIFQNGYFDVHDMLREELSFRKVFDNTEVGLLVNDLKEIF